MFKKLLLVLVILLVGGYAVAEVAAKSFAERSLAENAASKDPVATEVEAEVSSPLLWQLFTTSTIKRIQISTRHIAIGPFTADRVTAVLTNVHLDRAASIRESEPIVDSIGRLDMIVELGDDEVSKALPEGTTFEFVKDSVILKAGSLSVEGKLEVTEPDTIRFVPDSPLPGGVRPPSWKLEDIPFVSCIRNIEIHPGFVRVTCSQQDPPARFPPG